MNSTKPIALITGGSRGIGLALIKQYASAGYHIVTTCTTEAGKIAINSYVPDADIIVWNALHDPIETLTNVCENLFDCPEVLICNAGMTQDGLAIRMKESQWIDVYKVNTLAPCQLSAWILRKMYNKKRGSILFISSIVAHTSNVGQANYIASKAAIEGLTRALALEGGPRNIRVNCIAPGFIETDMTNKLSDEQIDATLKRIPLSRVGQPEEIAKCALFLTQEATYITGQILHVNGGLFFSA